MSENRLTPAEIEALLGQFADKPSVVSMTNAGSSSSETKRPPESSIFRSEDGDEPNHHNLERQSLVERKRRNRLWAIHEQVARESGISLSALLRAPVDVRLSAVEAISCRAFALSTAPYSVVCMLVSQTLSSRLALEMPSAILLPMLERMLGGSLDVMTPPKNRALSEIEQRLALKLAGCITQQLNRGWDSVYGLGLQIDRIETEANRMSIGPPDGEAMLVAFDVRLGKARAMVQFAIPPQAVDVLDAHLIEQCNSTVAYRQWPAYHADSAADHAELTAELRPSAISAEDVANLSVGDVIATEHRVDAPIVVALDGQPKYLGRIGATAGRKAVRIDNLIETDLENGAVQ